MKTIDIASETIRKCENLLKLGEERNELNKKELLKCEEIVAQQREKDIDQKDRIKELESGNSFGKALFGILGFVIGIVLPIPTIF